MRFLHLSISIYCKQFQISCELNGEPFCEPNLVHKMNLTNSKPQNGKYPVYARIIDGKIKKITKVNDTTINYTYDVTGNRISKAVTAGGVTNTTWYVRDARGNLMAVYKSGGSNLNLGEQHIYGSRLGVCKAVNNRLILLPASL